ncbi:hypothetical protein EV424DRAFT_1347116 [Suillus variegatus]|nr:hypothetical protein EV424DRAFT_1347116 [Suillus variegatus]
MVWMILVQQQVINVRLLVYAGHPPADLSNRTYITRGTETEICAAAVGAICCGAIAFPDRDKLRWPIEKAVQGRHEVFDYWLWVCPSRHLAGNPLYIDLSWSFCIGQRSESPINTQDSESLISNVTPFEIDVIPHGPCEVGWLLHKSVGRSVGLRHSTLATSGRNAATGSPSAD